MPPIPATDERLVQPPHFMQMSAHFPLSYINVYCSRCKTLVTVYPTHFAVNLICIKSFCPQNKHNSTLFVTGQFQWQSRLI